MKISLFHRGENLRHIFRCANRKEISNSVHCVVHSFALEILLRTYSRGKVDSVVILIGNNKMRRTGRSRFRIHSHSARLGRVAFSPAAIVPSRDFNLPLNGNIRPLCFLLWLSPSMYQDNGHCAGDHTR